jgi:ribosomal protein L25 (general stress protein Ctc)
MQTIVRRLGPCSRRSGVFVALRHRSLSTIQVPEIVENAINPPQPMPRVGRRQMAALMRTVSKTRQNQKLREQGMVPGVIHGINDDGTVLKHNITVDSKDLNREIRELGISIENTAYDLIINDANGETKSIYTVTPRQLATNPMTNAPMSVNFLKFQSGQRLRIPMRYVNTDLCVDLRRGCFLLRVNQFVECICENPDKIPQYIDVDVSNAGKGSVLTVRDLHFPSYVKPSNRIPSDFVAAVIKSK